MKAKHFVANFTISNDEPWKDEVRDEESVVTATFLGNGKSKDRKSEGSRIRTKKL